MRRMGLWKTLTAVAVLSLVVSACGSGGSSLGPTSQGNSGAAASEPAASGGSQGASENASQGSNTQAGAKTMTIAYKDDVATLDPAIGYDWTNWPLEKMVFDGLLDYDATTNLVPDLAAEMPTITDNATVWTFHLRKGVKFSNGREVTADDVVYTFTRVLDPKTKSPGAGFYMGIKGAQDFVDGKASTVSGIQKIDDYTVQFTLDHPDVTFGNKVALNFGFIVPKEAVDKYGDSFGHHPVGTGPFIFDSWTAGQKLVFKKNPNYWNPDLPKLDEVTVEVGVDPEVQLLRLKKGDIDLMGDPIPTADLATVLNDPSWKDRLTIAPQVSTIYLTLNTQVKPFDNVKVRQAIEMAIDKTRVIKLLGGQGTVANQILPPPMPGYDKNYKGYTYDPQKAKDLLAQAGYPDGFTTTLYCLDVAPQPKICTSFQTDLAKIGVKVNIQKEAGGTMITDAGTVKKAPMVWSGGLGWIQDYPDPSDFYGPILSCSAVGDGGWNWTDYCNKQLDAEAQAALAITDNAKRMAKYQDIYKQLMDEAVWVPVYNGEYIKAHSANLVGAKTDFAHPEHTIRYAHLSKK